jgi:hypothetical protein
MSGLPRPGQRDDRALARTAALREVTGPDDPVVADVTLAAGTYLLTLYTVSLLVITGWLALVVVFMPRPHPPAYLPYLPLVVVAIGLAGAAAHLRMPMYYLAVTRQQVVCLRVSRFRNRSMGVAFTAPLTAVGARIGRATPVGAGVRITAAGQRQPALRAARLPALAEVVPALKAGGASVSGPGAAAQPPT